MKIWKPFFIFFISYSIILFIQFIVILVIGYGFFQDVPKILNTITKIILFPVWIANLIVSVFTSKQVNSFIIMAIASIMVSLFFTALIVGIKAIVKKL